MTQLYKGMMINYIASYSSRADAIKVMFSIARAIMAQGLLTIIIIAIYSFQVCEVL